MKRQIGLTAAVGGEVALVAAGVLGVANERALGGTTHVVDTTLWGASWMGFAAVGAVVVLKRPRHPVGWILIGITSLLGAALLAGEYAELALAVRPEAGLPLGRTAIVVGNALQVAPFVLVPLLLLLFPDGEVPRGRMRWVFRLLLGLAVVDTLAFILKEGPVTGAGGALRNPLGLPGTERLLEEVTGGIGTTLAALFLVVVLDFVRRFRQSTGIRRQQFRWLSRAALVPPMLFVSGLTASAFWDVEGVMDWTDVVVLSAFVVGLPAMAAGIGVAVLRYRLWDIDRVVSRTVTYAVVTVVLAGTYGVLVLGMQLVVGPEDASDLVVAGSTLVAAALFRPVRDRVQRVVDRRFHRARFDHDRILADFVGRLQDEVEREAVERSLHTTVRTALAPAAVSLWTPPRSP